MLLIALLYDFFQRPFRLDQIPRIRVGFSGPPDGRQNGFRRGDRLQPHDGVYRQAAQIMAQWK